MDGIDSCFNVHTKLIVVVYLIVYVLIKLKFEKTHNENERINGVCGCKKKKINVISVFSK